MRWFDIHNKAILVGLSVFVAGAAAQTPLAINPGDQQQLRQQEREMQLRRQLEPVPEVRPQQAEAVPIPRLPAEESPCFVVNRIALEGELAGQFASLLSAANVDSNGVADTLIGRCIGSAGINIAMRRLQSQLMSLGYVTTRVLATSQTLAAGVLTLTLIPGRIRSVRFADGTSPRATKWNAAPLRRGELLNLRAIEQALENFKRVPSVDADLRIEPAVGDDAQPGDSDVVIAWRQRMPLRINLALDNTGLKATGRYQGAMTLSLDHAFTLNDLFYVSVVRNVLEPSTGSNGTRGNTAHYSLPFGDSLLSATAGRNNYVQRVANQPGTRIYSGESDNQELKLSRMLARDANRSTTVYLSAWARQADNEVAGMTIKVQHRRTAGWEAGLTHRQLVGKATLDLNAAYKRGTGAFGSTRILNEDEEGSTRPRLLQAGALFNLPFRLAGQNLRYMLALRAQQAWTALLPQDRFSIGSRYTVRGFDEQSTLSADRGWFVRNDIGLSLWGSGQEAYVGIDHGEVHGLHSKALAGTRLTGMAIGLRGGGRGVGYDLFIGRALSGPASLGGDGVNLGFSLSWSH